MDVRAVIMYGHLDQQSDGGYCRPPSDEGYAAPSTSVTVITRVAPGARVTPVVTRISDDQHWPDLALYLIDYR